MISGQVSPGRAPEVELWVYGMGGTCTAVRATVDTGFTGQLTLPAAVIAVLGLPKVGERTATLGDGSKARFDLFAGVVDWHGSPLSVVVEAAETDPLVGMQLLDDSDLRIDCRPGGAVEIDPRP